MGEGGGRGESIIGESSVAMRNVVRAYRHI